MGLKITVCAGVAVVAAVLIPTAYASGDGGRDDGGRGGSGGAGVSVTPSRPSPGSEVTLKATGCDARTATAASPAFVADAQLVVAEGAAGGLVGDTRVRSSLAAGGYDVRITCAGVQVKGRIEVLEPASATSGDPSATSDDPSAPAPAPDAPTPPADLNAPAPPAKPVAPAPPATPVPTSPATPLAAASPAAPGAVSPAASASPVAPVRAGGGGAAPLASVEDVRVDAHGPGTVQAVVGLVLAGVAAAVVVYRGLRRRRGTD
ncbi:hypothetical protein [Streptomyces sp. LUP30]|uniref:hypothetical protein n=1 Tax=Streptomyces sp. LUP30 TaxID=1890285 RepID=UPI000852198E|nr:hypothetical protein [Streptomyces sp. LUP30]